MTKDFTAGQCIMRDLCYVCQEKPSVHKLNDFIGGVCDACKKDVDDFSAAFAEAYIGLNK